MLAFFVALIVVGFVVYRVTTPAERARVIRLVVTRVREITRATIRSHVESAPFRNALRARTRWALVTPVLVVWYVAAFVYTLFGGTASDVPLLVEWGGNYGPRTTNGEWWRLLSATFLHVGLLHLIASVVGLIQVGLILERLIGPVAFATTYLAAGVFASLVSLSLNPVALTAGPSGAIFGVYGALAVTSVWSWAHSSELTITRPATKSLLPALIVFVVFNVISGALGIGGEMAGLAVGMAAGLLVVIDVEAQKAPLRRIASAVATGLVLVVASAATLSGIADVEPEIARVVSVEQSTSRTYEAAAEQFKSNRISAEKLAQLIEGTIISELRTVEARLGALEKVPREHQPFLATAEEYLRLRRESWRLRAAGLRKIGVPTARNVRGAEVESDTALRVRAETEHRSNMLLLARAETTERMSLETLKKLRP